MGRTKGVKNKKPQHRWTDEEKEYLASIVKGKAYKELLALMNEKFDYEFSSQQIESALRRYNLKTLKEEITLGGKEETAQCRSL